MSFARLLKTTGVLSGVGLLRLEVWLCADP